MLPDFEVEITPGGDAVEVVVRGEVDPATSGQLDEALRVAGARAMDVIVDLSAVTFFDSTGLRALAHAHARLAEAGQRLVVAAPSTVVRRVLMLSGLHDALHVTPPTGGGDEPDTDPVSDAEQAT